MKRALLGLALMLTLAAVHADAAPKPAFDDHRLSEHIHVLASDAFEGRGPATPGETKAVEYIVGQFKALGLQPAGDAGGWTQAVTLNRFVIGRPMTASFTVAGAAIPLTYGEQVILGSRKPGVSAVDIKAAPLVFVGYGVKAPERGWDDFKGVDLKGKVAVVLVNDPDFATAQPGRFDGRTMTYYGRWTYKFEELARQGALGVLIVHETDAAAYPWSVVRSSWSAPQFDIPRDPAERVLEEGWISHDAAVDLFQRAGLNYDTLRVAAQSADFRPVALGDATFSASYPVTMTQVVTHNVLAKLTGRRRPGEVVIYSAHWDHLGRGVADARGDDIYNGAADNASGVAGLLELARVFRAAPRTDRTVLFAAWTAEEKGLLGSEFYAHHPAFPVARTVANLNMDVLALFGATKDVVIVGLGKNDVEDDVRRLAAAQGRSIDPEPHPEAGSYYRSDHFSLAKVGVPAVHVHGGPDLVKGGRAAGAAAGDDYTAHHYHQPSDEWRADWDFAGARQDLELLYGVGRGLADSARWPGWKDGAEFKGERDLTARERN